MSKGPRKVDRGSVKPVAEWIQELSQRPRHPLTEWEEDFITSLGDQWDRTHRLSDKQTDILERIYDEKMLGEKPSRRY